MSQRQFDMENEKDVMDLFDILPNDIKEIKQVEGDTIYVQYNGYTGPLDLFKIKWDKVKVVESPFNKLKWIDCLVKVWNKSNEERKLCILWDWRKDEPNFVVRERGMCIRYKNCCPVKREEIKFVEDME